MSSGSIYFKLIFDVTEALLYLVTCRSESFRFSGGANNSPLAVNKSHGSHLNGHVCPNAVKLASFMMHSVGYQPRIKSLHIMA